MLLLILCQLVFLRNIASHYILLEPWQYRVIFAWVDNLVDCRVVAYSCRFVFVFWVGIVVLIAVSGIELETLDFYRGDSDEGLNSA